MNFRNTNVPMPELNVLCLLRKFDFGIFGCQCQKVCQWYNRWPGFIDL